LAGVGDLGVRTLTLSLRIQTVTGVLLESRLTGIIGDSQRNAVDKVGEILRPDAPKSENTGEWIQ
jgi:hypothetical protein